MEAEEIVGKQINPVDLVPLFRFDYNMQQSGTAATQYVVVFCYLLILNQPSPEYTR